MFGGAAACCYSQTAGLVVPLLEEAGDEPPDIHEPAETLSGGSTREVDSTDPHIFLQRAYTYLREGGLAAMVLRRCLRMLTFGVGTAAAWGLCHVDWVGLAGCAAAAECAAALHSPPSGPESDALTMYMVASSVGVAYELRRAAKALRWGAGMRRVYSEALGATDRELVCAGWVEVERKLGAADARLGLLRGAQPDPEAADTPAAGTSEDRVAGAVCREDNAMAALLASGALDPVLAACAPAPRWLLPPTLPAVTEWSIRRFVIAPALAGTGPQGGGAPPAAALRTRLALTGALLLLMAPLATAHAGVMWFLRNARSAQDRPYETLLSRRATSLTAWRARRLNEVPHLWEARMARASRAATEYVDSFPAPCSAQIVGFSGFLAGAAAGGLLLVGLVSDAALVSVTIMGHTLLFALAATGAAAASARGAATPRLADPTKTARARAALEAELLFDPAPGLPASHPAAREAVVTMFPHRFQAAAAAATEVVVAPLGLIARAPAAAPQLLAAMVEVAALDVADFEAAAPCHPAWARELRRDSAVAFARPRPHWAPRDPGLRAAVDIDRAAHTHRGAHPAAQEGLSISLASSIY